MTSEQPTRPQLLIRFVQTVRFLTFSQVYHRIRRTAQYRVWHLLSKKGPRPTVAATCNSQIMFHGLDAFGHQDLNHDVFETAILRAVGIMENRFCFVNHEVHYEGRNPDWQDQKQSQLWRFHLHYFDYFCDLSIYAALKDVTAAFTRVRTLVSSWIDANDIIRGDGWHPYTMSLRIVNWIHAAQFFHDRIASTPNFETKYLTSLYGQVQVLFRFLEHDVRGNHLLKNLKALLFAGLFFEGGEPQKWFNRAIDLLKRELAEQVLEDGGHFERCPGYHLQVLKDCLEVAIWLQRQAYPVPAWLNAAIRRMLRFVVRTFPSDLTVPLIKDTARDACPDPKEMLCAGALYLQEPRLKRCDDIGPYPLMLFGPSGVAQYRSWPLNRSHASSTWSVPSGWMVLRDDQRQDHLIFDVGRPCPDYLPAHAHADMFSYELTVAGQPVVVDSGVFEYQAGAWRDFFRSTRAHNTLEIDGENQSAVWGSFRVANRAKPSGLVWKPQGDHFLCQARHDGYHRRSHRAIHQRTLVWHRCGAWLIVDSVAQGRRRLKAVDHVHLNPSCRFEPVSAGLWRINGCRPTVWIQAFGHDRAEIICGQTEPFCQGWYSDTFGCRVSIDVLALVRNGTPPFHMGYIISVDEPVRVHPGNTGRAEFQMDIVYKKRRFQATVAAGTAVFA